MSDKESEEAKFTGMNSAMQKGIFLRCIFICLIRLILNSID